jgi:hypothetical protein
MLTAIASLATLALTQTPTQQPSNSLAVQQNNYKVFSLGDPDKPSTHLLFYVHLDRSNPPKYSPKKFGTDDPEPYEFDWEIEGLAKKHDSDPFEMRFHVYSQEYKPDGDIAPQVMRMLLHLWDLNYRKFKFDHQEIYNNIVDVYLCWGGTAGGEQRMDLDWDNQKPPRQVKVNTIYIYDINSFTNPIEMAREVAHEYGHAVLTPVGGFVDPEDWGNGQLGEKLFLMSCRQEMAHDRLAPADVMGATLPMLNAWLKKNVDPLVYQDATEGPQFGLLMGQGQASMDAFTGLVCYADTLFGDQVTGLSLKLTSQQAKDYPGALLTACEQVGHVIVAIPEALKGKDIWVPLGSGKVTGATVVKRNGDWALIRPGVVATTLIYGG